MASSPDNSARKPHQRPGARIACVVSAFHSDLTGAMLASAKRELAAGAVRESDVLEVWVPGAFEIPLVARRLALRDDVDCVIAIGLVLKGETSHDEHIARAASAGCLQAALEADKPVLLGVLTCETIEQARARALPPEAGGRLDKGREVARAALHVLDALDRSAAVGQVVKPAGFAVAGGEPGL